ncbi:hypothetical protein [Parashewanella tropica]|uniref:hypothetical protein n=1 Tax=Parashewanella tropica TaxID=2547970 RepID=UPI0011E4DFCC|nr:hypothetical protein [Parashewanella tropica]
MCSFKVKTLILGSCLLVVTQALATEKKSISEFLPTNMNGWLVDLHDCKTNTKYQEVDDPSTVDQLGFYRSEGFAILSDNQEEETEYLSTNRTQYWYEDNMELHRSIDALMLRFDRTSRVYTTKQVFRDGAWQKQYQAIFECKKGAVSDIN